MGLHPGRPDTGKSSKRAVWAGGDIVIGTVILAMGGVRAVDKHF